MTSSLNVALAAVLAIGSIAAGWMVKGDQQHRPAARDSGVSLEAWRDATVRIRSAGCGGVGVGSGFAIAPDLIITNRHVVEGGDRIQVSTWDGRSLDASAMALSSNNDLALIRVVGTLDWVAPSHTSSNPGTTVSALGYPAGNQFESRSGRVIDTVDGAPFEEAGDVVRATIAAEQGNSGGPVVDEHGALVGVLFAGEKQSGLTLVIDSATLATMPTEAQLRTPSC